MKQLFTFLFLALIYNSCGETSTNIPASDSYAVTLYGVFNHLAVPEEIEGCQPFISIQVLDASSGNKVHQLSTPLLDTLQRGSGSISSSLQEVVPLSSFSVPKGRYHILAWIDYRDSATLATPYNTQNLRAVSLKSSEGHSHIKQAFAGKQSISIPNGTYHRDSVALPFYNPLAQYAMMLTPSTQMEIGNKAIVQFADYYPDTYDIQTEQCVSVKLRPQFSFTPLTIGKDTLLVASDYIFVNRHQRADITCSILLSTPAGQVGYYTSPIVLESLVQNGYTEKILSTNQFKEISSLQIIDRQFAGEISVYTP